jgi:hypothetical protein
MAEIKARIRALLRLDQTTALNNPNYRNVPAKHPPSVQTAFRANRSSSCGLLVTNNNALRTDSVLMLRSCLKTKSLIYMIAEPASSRFLAG